MLLAYIFQAFGGLEGLSQFVDLVPETMRALLQAQGGFATSINGWLAGGYRHPVFLVALSAYWIAMALPNEFRSYSTILVEPQAVSPDLVAAGTASGQVT